MQLKALVKCTHKRVQHFFQIFPKLEFEYCTQVALKLKYDEDKFTNFNTTAFFAAQFTSRRMILTSQVAYRKDMPWAHQVHPGQAFAKITQNIYEAWHANIKGYLPIDRDMWSGSLVGARNREYAVCRLKPKFLQNIHDSREPPIYICCDEQVLPYHGFKSGAKKRLPKKISVG